MTTTFSRGDFVVTPQLVINAGVIGFGFIGEVHVRAIRAAGGVVTAIAAKTIEEAKAAANKMGIEKSLTIDELLTDPDIDVVHICTPNVFHAELAEKAIRAGKSVICEKPLAISVKQAQLLSDLVAENQTIATVPFVYRYHPSVREARARIKNMTDSLVLFHGYYLQDWLSRESTLNWRLDSSIGGPSRAFGDIGVHWCDLLEFVTGHRITHVNAQFMKVFASRGEKAAIDTEDGATMIFKTDKGAQGSLVLSQVSAGRKNKLWFSFESPTETFVFDQEAPESLWVGGLASNQIVFRGVAEESEEAKAYSFLPAGHSQGYQDCFNSFVSDTYRSISGITIDGVPTFTDGLRAAKITEAVLESSNTGNWVEIK
jgi:predicted dehydrogenase